jgi:hypothetical protein
MAIVAVLTMMKIAKISTKIENNSFLFDTYIKHNIENKIAKQSQKLKSPHAIFSCNL